jgi:RluA family pseudouridine synthase/TatA/E family protein of Tat protein translocase
VSDAQPLDPPIESPEDEGEEIVHFRWRIGKDLTRRLDQYLVDRVGYLSRNAVQGLIKEGLVKVNGKPSKPAYRPCEGDIVEMSAPPEPVSELTPEPIPLDIVYEDEFLLALNKQADLIVHPARGRWSGTLVNGLVYYGKKWSTINGDWRPGILHRLDRNTTGIMLVAKADEAHWRLARQFENRTIQKTYMAIVHGQPQLLADEINLPIGKDRHVREKQAVRKIEHGGKPAVTQYHVVETFSSPPGLLYDAGEHASDRALPAPPADKFARPAASSHRSNPSAARAHERHRSPDCRRHDVRRSHHHPGPQFRAAGIIDRRLDRAGRLPLRPASPSRPRNHLRAPGEPPADDPGRPFSTGFSTTARDFQTRGETILRRGCILNRRTCWTSGKVDFMLTPLALGMPGLFEWIIIAGLGLLLFGKRLPEVGKSLGRSIVEFKKGLKGIDDDMNSAGGAPPKLDPPRTE